MHQWKLEISAPCESVDPLNALLSGRGHAEIDQHGTVTLRLFDLNVINGVQNVDRAATAFLTPVYQLLNIASNIAQPIRPTRIHCEAPNHAGCGGFYAGLQFLVRSTSRESAAESEGFVSACGPSLIQLSSSNRRVAEVLAAFGAEDPDWGALYVVLEAISRSLRDDEEISGSEWQPIVAAGWLSSAEMKRLKQTANYHRHAVGSDASLPKRPFTLDEARSKVRSVVRRWLARLVAA